MKKIHAIPVLILFVALCSFITPPAARGDGEVQYTKEMILGKWFNVDLQFSSTQQGHMEIFIFNKNGTFEYEYYTLESETEKKTLTRFTGSFKVEKNTIYCMEEKTDNLQTDLFPPLWYIVADEQNAKLDQLELKPDPCRCGDLLFSRLFVRDRGV